MTINKLKSAYLVYVLLSGLIGGGISLAISTGSLDALTGLKLFLGFFSVTLLVATPYMLVWWKKVDEAVKEAHKWAWFWGGSVGMMLAIWVATINAFTQGVLVTGALTGLGLENHALEVGVMGTIILMSYGYIGAWVFWWSKHR
jgi:hypothetical protein